MTRRQQLEALRDRIAKATGPDREIDVALAQAIWPQLTQYQTYCVGDEEPLFFADPFYKQPCPHFTGSLDAAVTLVPDGYSQHINQSDDRSWWAEIREGYCTSYRNVYLGHAKTEALARCLARITLELAQLEEHRP